MIVAADFGTGQVFWSITWFSLFAIWLALLFSIFADIFRSTDLSGGAKALWLFGVIVFPYIGIFAYLIARGGTIQNRTQQRSAQRGPSGA